MKIRIYFSESEKTALFNELQIRDARSYKESGKYGEVSCIYETNIISADLNEKFITSSARLICNVANMVKGMVQFFQDYSEIWFSDNKVEEVKLASPTEKIKKD